MSRCVAQTECSILVFGLIMRGRKNIGFGGHLAIITVYEVPGLERSPGSPLEYKAMNDYNSKT